MKDVQWWKFWDPLSGAVGGVIAGVIYGVLIASAFFAIWRLYG